MSWSNLANHARHHKAKGPKGQGKRDPMRVEWIQRLKALNLPSKSDSYAGSRPFYPSERFPSLLVSSVMCDMAGLCGFAPAKCEEHGRW